MKRILIVIAAIMAFYTVGATAQTAVQELVGGETVTIECLGDSINVSPESALRVSVACNGEIATPTAVPTEEPTATPEPGVWIEPYPDAPECPTHDDRVQHGLWDYERGCHYDHEHGRLYPDWAQEIWGNYTDLTGYEIGYAWETPMENSMKHPGYNFDGYDFRDQPCSPFVTDGGVDAWYVQAHGMANAMGQQARVHSFFGMAHLCNEDGPAGIVMTGGWLDFGQLVSPYKGGPDAIVGADVYPKAPTPYDDEKPPYVGLAPGAANAAFETWNSNTRAASEDHVDAHQIMGIGFRINDPVGAWQTDGTFAEYGGNSSARQMYQIEVDITRLRPFVDNAGLIQFSGFTDVHGVYRPECTEASAECVPLVIIDGVPGEYSVNAPAAGLFGLRDFYEGDIYFNGVESGWIGGMN
jgi:hypothetical protein